MPEPVAAPPDQQRPAPIRTDRRVAALDVVRGFALLGILGPNIVAFSWPQAAMYEPEAMGGGLWNELSHATVSIFFFGKMMFLFALLFGAGVWFFDRKSASKAGTRCTMCGYDLIGSPDPAAATCPECGSAGPHIVPTSLMAGAGLWYRRMAVLLLVGIVHAFGFWYGDILVWYAWCGLLGLWWLRRINARTQLWTGVGLYAFGALLSLGCVGSAVWAVSAGHLDASEINGDPQAEISAYTGSYLAALKSRTFVLAVMYPFFLVPVFTFMGTGMMLTGLALTRLGVLTGEKPQAFYAKLAIGGLVGGISLSSLTYIALSMAGLGGFLWQGIGQPIGIPIALGYASALIWLTKVGKLAWLTSALAAVGRMAFSNYLLQTLICTTLFYGHGFGLFASIDYPGLWGIVVGVWLVNIVFSTLWLRSFKIGPAEWLWRLCTYARPPAWR